MIIADVHSHTLYSHAQATTADMYASAQDKGLRIFGFSEHSPRPQGYNYPSDYQERLEKGFPLYVAEVDALKAKGHIKALLGLELDYIPAEEAFAAKVCGAHDFDYVIAGLHFQDRWGFDNKAEDWAFADGKEYAARYERYYTDMERMCRTGLFNIVAHPDLIKIFSVERFRHWLESPGALELVHRALLAAKEAGMAMELSSAGLRKPCKEFYPGPQIMRLAADLGLPLSVGSDAHCVNTVAANFTELEDYARSFGYTQSVIFEKRRPTAVPFQ